MNAKTFNIKELLFFQVPAALGDVLIHLGVLKFILSVFKFYDPADLVMTRPRSVYFLVVGYLIAVALYPLRFFGRGMKFRAIVSRAFVQTFVTITVFAFSVFVLFGSFAGRFFLQEGILATICISIWHLTFKGIIRLMRRRGRNKVHVVIAGADENAFRLYRTLQDWGEFDEYKILGFFSPEGESLPDGATRLGGYEGMETYLSSNKVHCVYCSINPAKCTELVNSIIRTCENLFIDFYYVPNMDGYLHRKMSFSDMGHVTIVKLREEPLANPVNAACKRLFDILISALFLVTIFPFILLFVTIGTKLSSPGPVFFCQRRTGYRGKPFTMLKFRSMKVNDQADTLQATADDPRKTRFGDFLRRTSIDELPQFINVLLGDMSIIGPRPHMEYQTETYTKIIDEYLVRHMVKPGLTGWAQVHGCRGETKTVEQMAMRVKMDIWYIENWSVATDLKIFFMTVLQILKGDEQAY